MQPFIAQTKLRPVMGGTATAKQDSWGFQRKSLATRKRQTRRERRRADKQALQAAY